VSARRLSDTTDSSATAADTGPAGREGDRGRRDAAPSLIADPAGYQARWSEIQVGFVDSPRDAVRDADALVSDVIRQLVDGFTHERADQEAQWDRGDEVSTEQLRVALQRYRSFFERLLAT
jgi:hypothetical protein